MAAGDSISKATYTGTGYQELSPSSGDEWLITAMGCDVTTGYLQMSNDGGSNYYTMSSAARDFYSEPLSSDLHANSLTSHKLNLHISSTVKIRFYHTGNGNFWYMGIKVKD